MPDTPMVSILTNCKNGAPTIRACIEGVLAQTYPRIEYVFQDGGSTDGTLEIVKEYVERNPGRIRLNPEPDSCSEEGLFRGLKACHGEIIGSSMADEEMLPEAVAWAVAELNKLPHTGAIYGDVYLTDRDGKITGTYIPHPFSLNALICREVTPPFGASFFRREALLGAGLIARNWTWGIGEYELWLRIAMKYPVQYTPRVIAKYAFHSGTATYGQFLDDENYVNSRKSFLDRFFAEPDLPDSIRGMKEQAVAGLHLFIGEALRSLKEYPKARKHFQKALEHRPNPARVLESAEKLARAGLEWDSKMLRNNISGHLRKLPPQRVVCYGAGNDFREFLSSGVFDGHIVVAVIDNNRQKGDLVGGVPVIREDDLGQIAHDIIIVTSSQWAYELRTSAVRRSLDHDPYIPVI